MIEACCAKPEAAAQVRRGADPTAATADAMARPGELRTQQKR